MDFSYAIFNFPQNLKTFMMGSETVDPNTLCRDIDLRFTTLTPLWTGGVVTNQMDRIYTTGIIGCLRWWYEAILRGLGMSICDPTSDSRCLPNKGKDNYCPACKLFGATGQRRAFRVNLGNGKTISKDDNILLPSGRTHLRRPHGREYSVPGGWYLMGNSMMGHNIPLRFTSLTHSSEIQNLIDSLKITLALVARHGAVGGKTASGYGVIQLDDNKIEDVHTYISYLKEYVSKYRPAQTVRNDLPDIRDFFFAKFRFQTPDNNSTWWQNIQGISQTWDGFIIDGQNKIPLNQCLDYAQTTLQALFQRGVIPLSPAIRNFLRYHRKWGDGLGNTQKNFLFGTAGNKLCPLCYEKLTDPEDHNNNDYWCHKCHKPHSRGKEIRNVGSKINISHAYKIENNLWEFRVWGWVPSQTKQLQLKRDLFIDELFKALSDQNTWNWVFSNSLITPTIFERHFLNSTREDGFAYLEELLA